MKRKTSTNFSKSFTNIGRSPDFTMLSFEMSALPPTTSETLQKLRAQFAHGGTDAVENPHVFEMSDVKSAGGLTALKIIGNPADVLRETKERIFAA